MDMEAARLEELFTYQRLARGARQPSLLRDARAFRARALDALDEALAHDPGSPVILRRKGDILLQLGRVDEAVTLYLAADKTRLADIRWYFRAAGQLELLNRLKEAAWFLQVVARAPGVPDEYREIARLELAGLFMKLGDFAGAERVYRRLMRSPQIAPDSARTPPGAALATQLAEDPTGIHRLLIETLIRQNKLDAALSEAVKTVAAAPDDPRPLASLIEVYRARKEMPKAVEAAETFVAGHKDDQVGVLALIEALAEVGRVDDAVARATAFLEAHTDDVKVREEVVRIYREAGRAEEAEKFARGESGGEGQREFPAYGVAMALLEMYANSGDKAKALELAEEILRQNAVELNAAVAVITQLIKCLPPEECDKFCAEYSRQYPEDLRIPYAYAQLLKSRGEGDRAGALFVQMAERGAHFGDAYEAAALYLAGKGEILRAMKLYLSGVDSGFVAHPEGLVPTLVEAAEKPAEVAAELAAGSEDYATAQTTLYELVAGLYLDAGDDAAAEAAYRKALESPMPLLIDYAGLALALYRQEKTPEAIALVEDLMRKGRGAPPLVRMLVGMLTRDGRYTEAQALAQRLVLEAPTDIENRMSLVSALTERGDYASAERELATAQELAEGDAEALKRVRYMLGYVYDEQDKDDLAVEAWRAVLAVDPNDADSNNALGYHYADRGVNLEEAKALVEKALFAEPDNGAYLDSLGWVYYKMGDMPAAVGALTRAAAAEKDAVILEHLGDASLAAGDRPAALSAWRGALAARPKDKDRSRIEEKLKLNFPEADLTKAE